MTKLKFLMVLFAMVITLSSVALCPVSAVESGNETTVVQSTPTEEPASSSLPEEDPDFVSSSASITENVSTKPEEEISSSTDDTDDEDPSSSNDNSSQDEVTSYVDPYYEEEPIDDGNDGQDEQTYYGDENDNQTQYATEYSLTSYVAPAADLKTSDDSSDISEVTEKKVEKSIGSLPIDYGKFAKKFLWLPIVGIFAALIVLFAVNKKYGRSVLSGGRKKPDVRRAYSDSDSDYDDEDSDPYNLDRFDESHGNSSDSTTDDLGNDDFYDMITGEYDHYYSKPSDEDDLANYDENFRRIDRNNLRR